MESQGQYQKCPKCGITRNIIEAPDCPICRDKHGGQRDERPREQRPIIRNSNARFKYCPNCGDKMKVVRKKATDGGLFDFCSHCDEQL